MIKLPKPTTAENIIDWARRTVSLLELQSRNQELSQDASTKRAEELAEAKAWFNG